MTREELEYTLSLRHTQFTLGRETIVNILAHDAAQRQVIEQQAERIKELQVYDSRTIAHAEGKSNASQVQSVLLSAAPLTSSQIDLGKDVEIRRLTRELEQHAQEIEDLRKQLSESVPRSRYDACNQDWLDAKAKLKQVQQAASKEIKQLEGRVQALEGALGNCHMMSRRILHVEHTNKTVREKVEHVRRFCEEVGIHGNGILREAALAATGEEGKKA